MAIAEDWRLIAGRAGAPPAAAALVAGRVAARLEAPDLADVRVAGLEVIRRIGVRVRAPGWGTVAPELAGVEVTGSPGRFGASWAATHRQGQIDFGWRAAVSAGEEELVFEMDGAAGSDFDYARIGIVVLHPPEVTAGRPFRARGPAGDLEGRLPRLVGPQLVLDGETQPLFPAFHELDIDIGGGLTLTFAFEGDVFEMEDQRNWTDASFKTYSTPVGLPVPHQARAGRPFRQRVRVGIPGGARARRPRRTGAS
jgi:hypothetical protein